MSTALTLEYEEVLKRILKEQGKPLELAEQALDGLLALANRHSAPVRCRPMSPDADDDFIMELAIESRAAYLVTFNIRDFQALRRFGVCLVRPGEFLRIMEGRS
jgi:predicted nucleic acid-binding protein